MTKHCCGCDVELILSENWPAYLADKPYYKCIICYNKQRKLLRAKNKTKISKQKQDYYLRNKEEINSKRRVENLTPEQLESRRSDNKIYRDTNNEDINSRRRKRKKERFLNDTSYRIREAFGSHFRSSLKLQNIEKKSSCFDILDYTFNDLIERLESQFEPWMNWENYGAYNKEIWDDNDPSTRTWQIDHIIPKANFVFSINDHDEIKKCWALNNLRPYSAKQNNIDGGSRVRHNKKKES
jgi:hypothetical protein